MRDKMKETAPGEMLNGRQLGVPRLKIQDTIKAKQRMAISQTQSPMKVTERPVHFYDLKQTFQEETIGNFKSIKSKYRDSHMQSYFNATQDSVKLPKMK